ncbi:ribonuclease catalytic domain-containing protein [Ramlibacter algicola]|uniref:RNB domain-containing ribonuclease n=1 Tax=Ramlibacter algicola TaxID=2795217 RepID=A0A934UPX9_9BURK|nr:RNB domain-containing ribonuclease [Ramlibacter algicola]MBK0392034.1 RNB domain-containing ribonuclease [Ramlibacter algicola]
MYALFEEAGKHLAGRILSEAESSAQVELESGKRVKVKAANLLLRFDKPQPAQLLPAAQAIAAEIELDLAWEFAPGEEFGFDDLAREYFSANPSLEQRAAMLLRLFDAPHYFRRSGKGRFRKAPAEILQQALAAIERKKQVQAQIDTWAQDLAKGSCPAPIRDQLYRILFKPDKNGPEYKAVVEASRLAHKAPLALLQDAGAIDSPYQFHWKRFLFEHFPKGTDFPALQAPPAPADLPQATVRAFSIDDSATTEIDDALSLQGLGTGTVTLGIHIAAPGLAIAPGSPLDQVARQRLSTVYMPGHKITMLPDDVVQAYTLQEGCDCPAVSLYLVLDEATLEVRESSTRLERVPIVANLRHDKLDAFVTEEWLAGAAPAAPVPEPAASLQQELGFLWRLAQHLKAQREVVRGKPETFNRPDYTFRLVGHDGAEPDGSEQVEIGVRRRGAPLDLMVAEAMILANSTWGLWLGELGVPGIYRSQASLAPGMKVRMGTRALPHAGIGVKAYAWSTSPLRRYTDLVNQWQIIAAARHGRTAALAAPFKPKDAELLSVISSFDAAYTAYNGYQAAMERFWTLRYLRQHGMQELVGTVFREGLVRADDLPLVLPVLGTDALPRGSHVRVRLGAIDDITLEVSGTVIERLDLAADVSAPDDTEDEEPVAGPIAIAVDVTEGAEPDNASDNPAS